MADTENNPEELTVEELEVQKQSEAMAGAEDNSEDLEASEEGSVEEKLFVEDERLHSILESLLFASTRPVSVEVMKQSFKGTNVNKARIKTTLSQMAIDYANAERGVCLEEVSGGYQLRTKLDNLNFLKRSVKGRPFKLSGPALEVISIIAYKQPLIKAEIDEIRGVESGHLVRALMDKNLVQFAGKSELPGKPMLYKTTKKFLEIFGLRSIRELPSLSEIDELIPEGIGYEEDKETLDQLTDDLSLDYGARDEEAENELLKISDRLSNIDTSSEFFEEEKRRMKAKKEKDKADDIRERILLEHDVEERERRWLERYDERMLLEKANQEISTPEESQEAAENLTDDNASEVTSSEMASEQAQTENTDEAAVNLKADEEPQDTGETKPTEVVTTEGTTEIEATVEASKPDTELTETVQKATAANETEDSNEKVKQPTVENLAATAASIFEDDDTSL